MKQAVLGFLAVAVMVFSVGCTTTGPRSGDADTRRATIDSNADAALENLFNQVEGSTQLVDQARGVLIFPSVLEAGLVVGGSSGEGVLRKNGRSVSYHRITSGSWGLQAGAQSRAVFVLFMTDEALAGFENSEGWAVGADANVTLATVGANAQLNTATTQQTVIGFVLSNRGLMVGLTLTGSRVTRLNL